MTFSAATMQHLPDLRRYAFAMTGSTNMGDRYVAACLQAIRAAPDLLVDDDPRTGLFRLFHDVNGYPASASRIEGRTEVDDTPRLLLQLYSLEREERAVIVLARALAFEAEEIAAITGMTDSDVGRVLARARGRLAKFATAQVLIIEDDYLIAQEIVKLVEEMGQTACGPAATYEEALRCASECAPTLVLADIQLRDGGLAGLLAADTLVRDHDVPLIVITGYPDRVAQGGRVRPAHVFTKPFNYMALRSAIIANAEEAAA